jgi:hypothetical protein
VKISPTKNSRFIRSFPDRCLPTIVAVGSSLATMPAGALELGELTVQSRLGQPLRASIAYALAPTEQISNVCVTMRPGPSVSGLPGIGAARISIMNGVISLSGQTPVREPMVSAHVVINCPYAANLSREYLLFINPGTISEAPVYQETVVTQQATPQAEPVVVAPTAIERPVAAVRPEPVVRDIEASTRYQVQRGETLSEISARIQNRTIRLWPAVNAIFEANPSAFTNNNPDNLKAGSWLTIPSLDGNAAVVRDVEPTVADVEPTVADVEPAVADVEPNDAVVEVYEPSIAAELAPTEETSFTVETEVDPFVADVNSIVVDGGNANASSAIVLDDLASTSATVGELQADEIIMDTELPGPTTSSTSPNVTTAVIAIDRASDNRAIDNSGPPSWLNWLAGGVIAIVFGLVMYRRRLDVPTSADPEARFATDGPLLRFSDTQSTDTDSIETPRIDNVISDDSPTDENPILDADLVMSSDLSDSSNTDISGNFRFASSTELDFEAPPESVPDVLNAPVDSAPTVEVAALDSEAELFAKDDDYDMSAIVDASELELQQPDDVLEHDSKTAEFTTEEEQIDTQMLMTDKDADYQVLEQDYEDEMTATQALNLEIAHAVAELSAKMETEGLNETDDETSSLPLASVTELDLTAQVPALNDEILDSDETMESEVVTANTNTDEDTAEMPVESGKTG